MEFIEKIKAFFTKMKNSVDTSKIKNFHHEVSEIKSLKLNEADEEKLKNLDSHIVIGKIMEITPHPNEKVTKVRVTKTMIGARVHVILCGANNIYAGQIVPVAKVGAVLPEDFTIAEREIRGVTSHGMICAREELGLSPDPLAKKGIWELPTKFENKLGTPINTL